MKHPVARAKPLVLVAPLDWGLGHATRCIPIISELLARNCGVILAGEGGTASLLQREFPHLTLLPLKGYRVRYARTGWGLPLHIAGQVPRILSAIHEEHQWLKEMIPLHRID